LSTFRFALMVLAARRLRCCDITQKIKCFRRFAPPGNASCSKPVGDCKWFVLTIGHLDPHLPGASDQRAGASTISLGASRAIVGMLINNFRPTG
jgi:hypothetical protein